MTLNPKLDLVFERTIDVPREVVWDAWTVPEQLKQWFTPAPYSTVGCEIDLRPGGIFQFTNRAPEGKETTYLASYLEVVKHERLTWTVALGPGYRPILPKGPVPPFTAIVTFEAQGKGTKYRAVVLHANEDDCRKHDEMGFHEGWGAACDQLVAMGAKRSAGAP